MFEEEHSDGQRKLRIQKEEEAGTSRAQWIKVKRRGTSFDGS